MDVLLIDGLHELSDDQWDALYSFDLFLSAYQLALETSINKISQITSASVRLEPYLCSSLMYSS